MTRVRAGFTLIEAVVALVIIGMSAAGVLGAFTVQARAQVEVQRAARLTALAQDISARIALAERSVGVPLADSLASGRFDAPFAELTWRAKVESLAGLANVEQLTVTVADAENTFTVRSVRAHRSAGFAP